MSDIVEVQPEITGSEAPNQPMADPENASSVETTNQPQEEADRPEWLPEKFQSAEDLASAYKELEGKLGQPKEEEEETAAESEEGEQEPTKVDEWQTKIEPFTKEYAEKGELTEDSFNKLNEMGYPRELVESYMAGQEALGRVGSVQENEILSKVGGQEAYAEMTEWARDNLSEVELQSYNKTMDGGDGGAAELAVMGLQARFQAANSTPNLLTGDAKGGGKGKAIRSNGELIELMSDPRYKEDAAFRDDVQKRLAVSDIL
jgi:hypothetical protein